MAFKAFKSFFKGKPVQILQVECPICLEKYKIGEYKRKLHFCNHIFHKKCIDKWLINNINCPICRKDYY